MKKVWGIIALAACIACTEKPKSITHPELEDVAIWSCIDKLQDEFIMLNESGSDMPEIARYAWADIDGDGMAELFLGSEEGEFPEISAAFALGGDEPQCLGFEDASHSMSFFPEGVCTRGTGTIRYNYMDRRSRMTDSRLLWELTMEETKDVYREMGEDFGGNSFWNPDTEEYREPSDESTQAMLEEFSDEYELTLDWQPLDKLYETASFTHGDVTIDYNASRYEIARQEELGTDFTLLLQNPKDPFEWIRLDCYYDDGLDVMQENENAELIAQLLQGTCEENSLSISEDDEYEELDSYFSELYYDQPEKGCYYGYEAGHEGKNVHGSIAVRPLKGGNVLVMRSQTLSFHTANRILEQFPMLTFDR